MKARTKRILMFLVLTAIAWGSVISYNVIEERKFQQEIADRERRNAEFRAEEKARRQAQQKDWEKNLIPTPIPGQKSTPKPVYTPKPSKSSSSSSGSKKKYVFPDDDDYYMDEDEWLIWHGDEYDSEEEALDMYYWLYW
ncbi:MAG: hypothetical protein Q4F31_09570 [Eubacteriales bacterium]|nr:hypothetical protein [Eubacteriales bacterium]